MGSFVKGKDGPFVQIEPEFSRKIVSAGGDTLYLCFQCGVCTGGCPPARLSDFRIRKLVRLAQFGLGNRILPSDSLWMCTACYKCHVRCPRGVDIPGIVTTLRNLAVREGLAPEAVVLAEKAIDSVKNPFGMDNSMRTEWSLYTGAELKLKKEADVVYFVGCVTAYSGRLQGVAHAITSILNHVGENWTLLEGEHCCGHVLMLSGAKNKFKEIAEQNLRAVEATGAKRLVTGCPSCFWAFKTEYAEALGRNPRFEVVHFTQLLDEYLREDKLSGTRFEGRVTYHDPCELGRLAGIYHAPRNLLHAFATEFVEARENLRDGRCCGAGGFVKGTNLSLASDLADVRLKILAETGAEVCISACPSCDLMLGEAVLREEGSPRVLDLAEFVAQQVGLL